MNSDSDLPHQQQPLQQKPTSSLKSLIWKVVFALLLVVMLIVNAILGFRLLVYGRGYELIQFSFFLLPIINLFHLSLLFCYDLLIAKKNNFGLLKVSFILLIIVNLIVGYSMYGQAHGDIGVGFLGFFLLMFVVGINDLIALLFLQHYTRS